MLRFIPRLGDVEGAQGTAPAPAQHGSLSSARRGSAAAGRPAGEQPNPAAAVELGHIRRAMLVVICLSENCADDESAVPLTRAARLRFDWLGGVGLHSGQAGSA